MEKVRLGRTGLMVSRTSFGAIPIQRITDEQAVALLRKAYDAGITLYDTARGYSDSEHKIGLALSGVREHVIIATKTPSRTREGILQDVETSLAMLQTDYIDVYQFHNPPFVPLPGDELYDTMLELKAQGKIRAIGITNHDLALAQEAVASGHYDTLQFPFSPISSPEELALSEACKAADMGLLAMKALCGGLVTHAASAFAFLRQYENVVPIWGIEQEWQLDEFIALAAMPPRMTEEIRNQIEHDRKTLAGSFCRGCGYCLPCPAEINIPTAARISLLLGRTSVAGLVTPEAQASIRRINDCVHCGHCTAHCPYHLDTPSLLAGELVKYEAFLVEHGYA